MLNRQNNVTDMLVNLNDSNIREAEAKEIAENLYQGQYPDFTKLSLANNPLGNKGVSYIARALNSPDIPRGLVLNLENTNCGYEGRIKLVDAAANNLTFFKINLGKLPKIRGRARDQRLIDRMALQNIAGDLYPKLYSERYLDFFQEDWWACLLLLNFYRSEPGQRMLSMSTDLIFLIADFIPRSTPEELGYRP